MSTPLLVRGGSQTLRVEDMNMPNYAIMRCKKIKSFGCGASSMQHNFRERKTDNADSERTPSNIHLKAENTNQAMKSWREQLPEKYRKDAVMMVEYVMSASPEWMKNATGKQKDEFFKCSMDWLKKKYGDKNIVVATVQKDESTPHLSAFVVPLTKEGKLSAKEFIGGRTKLRNDQSTYANDVAHLGLTRGIEGSTAKHQRVKTHYAQINKSVDQAPKITNDELKPQKTGVLKKESGDDVVKRINDKIEKSFKPVIARASVVEQERRKSRGLTQVYQKAQNSLHELIRAVKGLSSDQLKKVMDLIMSFHKENELKRKKRRTDILKDLSLIHI